MPVHSTPTQAFVTRSGRPVQLRAVNVIPVWRHAPGHTWRERDYLAIRQHGFNAVRFVLYWDVMEPSRGRFREDRLRTLDTAVARAGAAGLYVILDEVHLWGPGGMNDVPDWARAGDSVQSVERNAGAYLMRIAQRYRSNRTVVAYDLVSEFYRYPLDQNAVLRAYTRLIRKVRSVDPAKIILIEPTFGDTSIAGHLADFANLADRRNIVWSIHDFFAGGPNDGYSASGSQQGDYTWSGHTGYRHPNIRQLEAHVAAQVDAARRVGLPTWVGEFGIGAGTVNHDLWISSQVSVFKKYGLGWAWWAYGTPGGFSITGPAGWHRWAQLVAGR